MAKYYLINGETGKGEALDILVGDQLTRSFSDIAALDWETLKIKRQDAKNILGEYNKDASLSGRFFDASYPHAKTIIDKSGRKDKITQTRTYSTMFDIDDPKVKELLDKFRYFTEQRMYNKEHKNNLELDRNAKLYEFIDKYVYDILDKDARWITKDGSQIARDLKDIINSRRFYTKGTGEFVRSNRYNLLKYLTNYTQLRYLTLEYMMHLLGENCDSRQTLSSLSTYRNKGMEDIEPRYYDGVEYKQLTLDMFGIK